MEFELGEKVIVTSIYVNKLGVITGQNFNGENLYYVEDSRTSYDLGLFNSKLLITIKNMSEYEKLIYGI